MEGQKKQRGARKKKQYEAARKATRGNGNLPFRTEGKILTGRIKGDGTRLHRLVGEEEGYVQKWVHALAQSN